MSTKKVVYKTPVPCGFQFGVSDDDRGFTDEQWRQQWIDGGMTWDKGRTEPLERSRLLIGTQ